MTGIVFKAFDVALVERDEDLQKLLPEWWGLWSRVPSATPFGSPAWQLPWWRTFRPGVLHALALRRDGRLVGLSPGYVEDGPWGRRLLPLGLGVSDYLDVLVDPEVDGVSEALVAETLRRSAAWDSWELEEMLPEAAGLALPVADEAAGPRPQSASPVLTLPDLRDWPATPAGRRWRRAWNRLNRHDDIRIVEASAAGALDLLAGLIDLHGRRWTAAGEPGVLASADVQRFHRDAVPRLLDAGLLQLFGLTAGGTLIGAYYGFLHRHRAYGYLSGYDPRWHFESPGAALLGHAMRSALLQGCAEYHFLRGREPYKYAWGASDRWTLARSVRSPASKDALARPDW